MESKTFLQETIWLGHEITEHGKKPKKDKIKAILKFKSPTSCKELKPFLGAVQCIAKFIPRLSKIPTA